MTNSDEPIPRADGGPAFPASSHVHREYVEWTESRYSGMTLRDYFAGQALAGVSESGVMADYDGAHIAQVCWRLADAMLAERSRGGIMGPPEPGEERSVPPVNQNEGEEAS